MDWSDKVSTAHIGAKYDRALLMWKQIVMMIMVTVKTMMRTCLIRSVAYMTQMLKGTVIKGGELSAPDMKRIYALFLK